MGYVAAHEQLSSPVQAIALVYSDSDAVGSRQMYDTFLNLLKQKIKVIFSLSLVTINFFVGVWHCWGIAMRCPNIII